MVYYIKRLSLLLLIIISLPSFAQEGTRNTASKAGDITGKVMIIPFEPKLFMSEIDMKVNEITHWNSGTIHENFRHQLDTQVKQKMESVGSVVSFYSDSSKTWKDLMYIYKSTTLNSDLVDKSTKTTASKTNPSGIKNGQVEVETNEAKKYMNTKITDNELLDFLVKKYESEYFVFVNELDILTVPDSYNISTDSYEREAGVHYTIFDKTGKNISSGLITSRFSSKENNPKKIVALAFAPIAKTMADKLLAIANPKPATPSKK